MDTGCFIQTRQGTVMALLRIRGCESCSALLKFAIGISCIFSGYGSLFVEAYKDFVVINNRKESTHDI